MADGLEAAIEDYDQAIALLPDSPDRAMAFLNRGLARQALGGLEAAIEVVDPRERTLPDVGHLTLVDPETGAMVDELVKVFDADYRAEVRFQ